MKRNRTMSEIQISEVLCLLFNNFDKAEGSRLSAIIANFYTTDEICNAKVALFKVAEKVYTGSDLPDYRKRKGDNKSKISSDDIIELFSVMDEQNLLSKLPQYIALDLSRIPTLNVEHIKYANLARKVEKLEARLSMNENIVSDMIITPKMASDVNITTNCKSMASQDKPDDDDDDKTCVMKVIDGSGNNIQSPHPTSVRSFAIVAAENAQAEIKTSYTGKKTVKRKIMVSSGNKMVGSLVAGVTLIKKSVFYVDNLNESVTVEKIRDHLIKNNISIQSCFSAKHG